MKMTITAPLFAIGIAACALHTADDPGVDDSNLRCRDCDGTGGDGGSGGRTTGGTGGIKPAPTPSSFTLTAGQLASTLSIALNGSVIQVSQNLETPADIQEGKIQCYIDYSGEETCKQNCLDLDDPTDPAAVSNCLKGCQSQQKEVCTPAPVCGTYKEYSYLHVGDVLTSLAGRKACDPADCQPCDANGTEAAVFDRAFTGIPYPIVTKTVGLITYHCALTRLRFDINTDVAVAIDLGGIHVTLTGNADSPAITCDNGAPDLDVGSPTVVIDIFPNSYNNTIYATTLSHFYGKVSAHNPLGEIIDWIDDAQNLVTTNASTAINKQVPKLNGAFGKGLDTLVRNAAPQKIGQIDHIAYGAGGLTIYYFPAP
jgi:hypothetical protein